MEKILNPLLTIISTACFLKLYELKCMSGVNNIVDIGCRRIKESQSAIAKALSISLLIMVIAISLLTHVSILVPVAIFLTYHFIMVFILTLCVNYHTQTKEVSTKEFVLKELSSIKDPLFIFFAISIICVGIYAEMPLLYANLMVIGAVLILLFPAYKILNSLFSIIAYFPSKIISDYFIMLMQKKLSAKLIWCYLSVLIVQIIFEYL